MNALEYFDDVYVVERQLCDSSRLNVAISLRQFNQFANSPPIETITPILVSRWVMSMESSGKYAPRTIHGKRGDLLVVLRHAYETGAIETRPERIRKVRVPMPQPDSWSAEQIAALIAAAEKFPGTLPNGTPRCDYFTALIRAAFDTGLRRSDLFLVTREQLSQSPIVLRQRKTGSIHAVELRPETRVAIAKLPGETPLAWSGCLQHLYRDWRTLRESAGLSGKGALQKMRRTAATAVEIAMPGMAGKFLGHLTPGLAAKHYLDHARLVKAILPPTG